MSMQYMMDETNNLLQNGSSNSTASCSRGGTISAAMADQGTDGSAAAGGLMGIDEQGAAGAFLGFDESLVRTTASLFAPGSEPDMSAHLQHIINHHPNLHVHHNLNHHHQQDIAADHHHQISKADHHLGAASVPNGLQEYDIEDHGHLFPDMFHQAAAAAAASHNHIQLINDHDHVEADQQLNHSVNQQSAAANWEENNIHALQEMVRLHPAFQNCSAAANSSSSSSAAILQHQLQQQYPEHSHGYHQQHQHMFNAFSAAEAMNQIHHSQHQHQLHLSPVPASAYYNSNKSINPPESEILSLLQLPRTSMNGSIISSTSSPNSLCGRLNSAHNYNLQNGTPATPSTPVPAASSHEAASLLYDHHIRLHHSHSHYPSAALKNVLLHNFATAGTDPAADAMNLSIQHHLHILNEGGAEAQKAVVAAMEAQQAAGILAPEAAAGLMLNMDQCMNMIHEQEMNNAIANGSVAAARHELQAQFGHGAAAGAALFEFKRPEHVGVGSGGAKADSRGMNHFATERQRREYLNEKYQTLRSLVPNPTKADRASIVQDAIEYVKELKRTVQELQILKQQQKARRQHQQLLQTNNNKLKRKLTMDECMHLGGIVGDMESSSHQRAIATNGDNSCGLLRSSLLQRTSQHGTHVDVRIVEEDVNIKLIQKKRNFSSNHHSPTKHQSSLLLDIVTTLQELHLDLLSANGATIGDHNVFTLNTKIMEGHSTYAGQVAIRLIEVVDRRFCNTLSSF